MRRWNYHLLLLEVITSFKFYLYNKILLLKNIQNNSGAEILVMGKMTSVKTKKINQIFYVCDKCVFS